MAKDMSAEYAKAIDDLDGLFAQGKVTRGQYDVQRAKLLKEASARKLTTVQGVALVFLVIVLLFIVLRIVGFLVNASNAL